MQVSLDPETEPILQRELARGHYASSEDAVASAVRLLAEQNDDWLLRNREAVQTALEESLAAEARGDSYTPRTRPSHATQTRTEWLNMRPEAGCPTSRF